MSDHNLGHIFKAMALVCIPTFTAVCIVGYVVNNQGTGPDDALREEPILTTRLNGCNLDANYRADISGKTAKELNGEFFTVTCDGRGTFGNNETLRLWVQTPPGTQDGTQQVRVRGYGGLQYYAVGDNFNFDL